MSTDRGETDTGVPVYPRLPVPKQRESDPRLPQKKARLNKLLLVVLGGVFAFGLIVGFVIRPVLAPDARIDRLETKAAEADQAAASQKSRADELVTQLDQAKAETKTIETRLADAEKAQATLADNAADLAKARKDAEAVQAKLEKAVARAGSVAIKGEEVHVVIPDRVLFTGRGDLTAGGTKLLDKIALALNELPSQTVAVGGHTDDSVPRQPPAPKPAPAPPARRGRKAAPPPPPAPVKRVTNWEVASERALTVLRYLQEQGKVRPRRLTGVVFGQYRPARRNRAANRRIELVLSPRPAAKPAAKKL